MTWTTMELLPLVCLCVLTWSGSTSADVNGPDVVKVVVKEGEDAILPCSLSTKENIKFKLFDWKKDGQKEVFLYNAGHTYNNGHTGQDEQFKQRVFHFPDQLKVGNASIVIKQTKVTDRGNYTCIFPRLQPQRRFHIELVVGAARKPTVVALKVTQHIAVLQCEVQGAFPKPQLQWQDRGGNIVPAEKPQVTERGGRYDVILKTTVTKTDNYSCVVTQEINHQVYSETYVNISGSGFPTGVVVGLVVFVVGVLVVIVAALYIRWYKNVVKVVVKEGEDAILPCSLSTKENIELKLFDWKKDGQKEDDQKEVFMYDAGHTYNNGHTGQDDQFKQRVFHFPDQLKVGDASIVIKQTKVTDRGNYTCIFPKLQPPRRFHIELVVERRRRQNDQDVSEPMMRNAER